MILSSGTTKCWPHSRHTTSNHPAPAPSTTAHPVECVRRELLAHTCLNFPQIRCTNALHIGHDDEEDKELVVATSRSVSVNSMAIVYRHYFPFGT